jgi:hypothetical protein
MRTSASLSQDELVREVIRLRGDPASSQQLGHDLCWHYPELWSLLPVLTDPIPTVPAWPEFLRGCIRYRQALDEQLPAAPRMHDEYEG